MRVHNAKYPPAYRNQPVRLRQKALEIANNLMMHGVDENIAMECGLSKAREFFLAQGRQERHIDPDLPAIP